MDISDLIVILLAPVVLLVVNAFALSVVMFIVKAWTRLYTMAAPEHERESRRAEATSVLHEQRSASRAEGYKPAEVAIRVLIPHGAENQERHGLASAISSDHTC